MNETRTPDTQTPDPLAAIRGALAEALYGRLLAGRLSIVRGSHSRRYTKAYADGRQRRGGKLWCQEQRRLRRPISSD